jgi:hypothetical protein
MINRSDHHLTLIEAGCHRARDEEEAMANAIGTSFTSLLVINLFEQVLYSKLQFAVSDLCGCDESTGFMADAAIREPSCLPVQK